MNHQQNHPQTQLHLHIQLQLQQLKHSGNSGPQKHSFTLPDSITFRYGKE